MKVKDFHVPIVTTKQLEKGTLLLLFVLRSNIYSSNISNVKMLKMSLTLVVTEDSNPGAFEEDMISEIFLDF